MLAMMLRRFDLELADPEYQLDIMETLTIKPHGLHIHAKRRSTVVNANLPTAAPSAQAKGKTDATPAASATEVPEGTPMQLAYGSNAGSAEGFARQIGSDAPKHGYSPTIGTLDSLVDKLPELRFLIVVTASYEGKPPDNAKKFMAYLETLAPNSLKDLKYGVFGVGNKDWQRTYQLIPKTVDSKLAELGATRICARGEANARGDFFGDFDGWYAKFWASVEEGLGKQAGATVSTADAQVSAPAFEVEYVKAVREPLIRQNNLQMGTLVANRELVDMSNPLGRSKRYIEIALPEGMTYRTGDYLAILPLNPVEQIDRVLARYGLSYDVQIVLHANKDVLTSLPTEQPIMVGEILSAYVELASPATKAQVSVLAAATECPPEKKQLEALIADQESYETQVLHKRVSVLDLLERFQSTSLPFASFLHMLPTLKPRQYSISSSPLWSKEHCTLTVAVVNSPAASGQGTYLGVASNYLARSRPGTKVAVTVRPSQAAFHPPEDLTLPLIMACAGTGLAPFYGFLQDRSIRVAQAGGMEASKAAPALLFFGCDHPDVDFLYKDQLAKWESEGLVKVYPAFTHAEQDGVRFVQHRLWKERAEVVELFKQGAVFFLCGDGQRMAPSVYQTCLGIYKEATGKSDDESAEWLDEMQRTHGRYVADVFA